MRNIVGIIIGNNRMRINKKCEIKVGTVIIQNLQTIFSKEEQKELSELIGIRNKPEFSKKKAF